MTDPNPPCPVKDCPQTQPCDEHEPATCHIRMPHGPCEKCDRDQNAGTTGTIYGDTTVIISLKGPHAERGLKWMLGKLFPYYDETTKLTGELWDSLRKFEQQKP